MNTAQIMEILKKNVFSLVCAVIAIAAVIATFWPVGGMYAQLKTQADQHASMYSQLQSLLTKERKLPLTDPTQTTQDPLTSFPNDKTIALGGEVTKRVSDDSKKMVDFVNKVNRDPHALLVADALPSPQSDTPKFIFGDLYKLVLSMDPAVSIKTEPKLQNAKAPNIRNDILNAGVPPTEQEITNRKSEIFQSDFAPRIITVNGQPVNQAQVNQDFANRILTLPDEMKMEVAKTKKIYLAPDALTMNPNVIANNAPAPVDIWYAQLALWIQQDVSTAIAQANAKSKNITDAPVKHFLKLTIPPPPGTYVLQINAAAGGVAPAPTPVEGGDTVAVPKVTTVSPTGRVSNAMYDVVQFQLALNVDASQVPYVIAMLGQNRLIDVYNVDVVTVDSAAQATAGFMYGTAPVVRLNLKCEALFMRQWTAPLMPDRVRVAIGIPPVTPLPPGMTPQ